MLLLCGHFDMQSYPRLGVPGHYGLAGGLS